MEENERYNQICKKEFEDIKTNSDEKFAKIQESLDKFYIAIFEGNGTPGLKTQVEMHSRVINGLIWFGGVIITATITLIVEVHFKK